MRETSGKGCLLLTKHTSGKNLPSVWRILIFPGRDFQVDSTCTKSKEKRPPLRLTYHVNEDEFVVIALSAGKRDGDVYKEMIERYQNKNS